jgi:hypothetical protein
VHPQTEEKKKANKRTNVQKPTALINTKCPTTGKIKHTKQQVF